MFTCDGEQIVAIYPAPQGDGTICLKKYMYAKRTVFMEVEAFQIGHVNKQTGPKRAFREIF